MMIRAVRTLLATLGALSLGACVSAPRAPDAGLAPATDHEYLRARWLMVPVVGIRARDVPDTYTAKRAQNRQHNATDILAPRGTPVVAADDGRVIKLAQNAAGGTTIYATDPSERFIYYYAHLDRYQDGLVEGMRLAKGQVIGYVGTTGNAPAGTPHLHFAITDMAGGTDCWRGRPLDPYPLFR